MTVLLLIKLSKAFFVAKKTYQITYIPVGLEPY